MNAGMLWFDNDPKTSMAAKVERAANYYTKKYGHDPNLCLVNPDALIVDLELPTIQIRPYKPVLPGHLWIGVEDKLNMD